MDSQALINSMKQMQSDTRAEYHLTYGQLIEALKNAPKDAVFDTRIKGIGSWRGSYVEVAIFTKDTGYDVEDSELQEYSSEAMKEHDKNHTWGSDKLPTNANELGELLESFIGKYFVGWKGGHFEITRNKPLWLTEEAGFSGDTAVIGIDEKLNLITKEVEL